MTRCAVTVPCRVGGSGLCAALPRPTGGGCPQRNATQRKCNPSRAPAVAARVRGVREMQARLQADLERAASAAAAAGSGSDDEPKTPTAAQQAAPDPGDAAATARFAARLEELLQSTGPEVAAMQAALDDVTRRFRWGVGRRLLAGGRRLALLGATQWQCVYCAHQVLVDKRPVCSVCAFTKP